MGVNKDEFCDLLRRAYAGSEQAAAELVDRFGPAVRLAVRRNLEPPLRSKFDSLDIVQDVWKSFFTSPSGRKQFNHPSHFAAYLTKMAHNKVLQANRQRLKFQKYKVSREVSIHQLSESDLGQLVAHVQRPSEEVKGREEQQRLLDRLPPVYQRILIRVLEGKTAVQIAAELGLRPRSIRRVVARILGNPS